MSKKMQIPSLNGLRAISVLMVICGHLDLQKNSFNSLKDIKWLLPFIDLVTDSQLGVNVFFVISGFLITTLLLTEEIEKNGISVKNFYIRRVLRIFPAYYFLLLIYAILQFNGIIHLSKISWFTSLTYTKFLNRSADYETAHFWTLSIEEIFYLFWPFIFSLGNRQRKYAAFGIILIEPLLRIYFYVNPNGIFKQGGVFLRFDAIAIGCVCALFKEYILKILQINFKLFFGISLMGLLIIRYFKIWFNTIHLGYLFIPFGITDGLFADIFIATIIMYSVFCVKSGVWYNILNNKVFNQIGILSYSIYLWQMIFMANLPFWVNNTPQNIVFALLCAVSSYYFIEKPFLSLKSKFSV